MQRSDMLALRAGEISFDEFAKRAAGGLRRMAGWFANRWSGQLVMSEDDIIQEMLIAVWRAIDSWDPAKTPDIQRYVHYQMGKRAGGELRRFHGRPEKGRRPPAKPVWVDDMTRVMDTRTTEQTTQQAARTTDQVVKRDLVGRMAPGLERDLAAGLLVGKTLDQVADAVYADPVRRMRYRLDCREEARQRVRQKAREIKRRQTAA